MIKRVKTRPLKSAVLGEMAQEGGRSRKAGYKKVPGKYEASPVCIVSSDQPRIGTMIRVSQ